VEHKYLLFKALRPICIHTGMVADAHLPLPLRTKNWPPCACAGSARPHQTAEILPTGVRGG